MDCERAQDEILEACDTARPAEVQAAVAAHVADCADCAVFARKQRTLDRQLASMLVSPQLTPRVRAAVRERVRGERQLFWSDLLPDLVHFASCGIVMVIGLVWLPISAPVVLSLGAIGTVLTHAALMAFHESLDAADDWAS